MAIEINESTGAVGASARNGRIIRNEKSGRDEVYDENGNLQMLIGDVRDRPIAEGQFGIVYVDVNGQDKVFQGPKSTGIIETYFIGKLQCDITGGSLDGVTYSEYQLTIRLYHRFSVQFPIFQLLFDWWGQEQNEDFSANFVTITRNKTMPVLEYSGGTATQASSGYSPYGHGQGELHYLEGVTDSNDPTNPNTEYQEWFLSITRVSGTVVIPPQTFFLITMLFYLNQVLPTITAEPVYAQGGGGGILSEELNFYL